MIHKNWAELIKPTQLDVKPGNDPARQATVVAEPLERGFGLTLGNALRRVLMSSLQGAAITSVQIDNVLHEFSSVAGVREDVTDIILNLKGRCRCAWKSKAPSACRSMPKAPQLSPLVTSRESAGIEVLNRDHVICHLDDGADLFMELTVNTGKGYVSADKNKPEDAPIGLIPIDAIYSPVKKVSYDVQPTREGQVLDYDKLTMKIETDGSITPDDAVAFAARILQDQLSIFVNFDEPESGWPPGRGRWSGVQPASAEESGRAGTVGAFGKLPEERQHRLHRRSDPEDRSRDAAHPELRPQVAERDQGSAVGHGSAPRHGRRGLAAGQHRRSGQEIRRQLLKVRGGWRPPHPMPGLPGTEMGISAPRRAADTHRRPDKAKRVNEGIEKCVTHVATAA